MKKLLFICLLIADLGFAQGRKKVYNFPTCNNTDDNSIENIFNTDLTITDEEITDWVAKNAPDTMLRSPANLFFVFETKKGACCKRLEVPDSLKAKASNFTLLITKLKEYPKFKELADKCEKPKLLEVVVIYSRPDKKYTVGLLPYF
jgi:hypothetical protein